MAARVVVGAVLGALMGALAGPADTGVGERALLGALAGAIIGSGRAESAKRVIDVAATGVR